MRRRLEPSEAETLLDADVPARLATIGSDGFPHITPLWFVWTDRAFYMTSSPLAAHCKRLAADSRASVCLDIEAGERGDGQRPNRRIVASAMPRFSLTRAVSGPAGSQRSTFEARQPPRRPNAVRVERGS